MHRHIIVCVFVALIGGQAVAQDTPTMLEQTREQELVWNKIVNDSLII